MNGHDRCVDIEFTLALNNRTGRYCVGRSFIDSSPDLIHSVLYWRIPLAKTPKSLIARILGRIARDEIQFWRAIPLFHRLIPLINRPRPVVFMDPREVIMHRLKASDWVLCHDVGPISHPELYHPKVKPIYDMAFAKIVAAQPGMVFVTHSAMRAFMDLYGANFRSMTVIAPALRGGLTEGALEPVPTVAAPFLLTVGSIGARKNQARSIEAFVRSGLSARGYSYVICGGPEPGFEAVAALADRTPGVIRPGYVSAAQLRWLYRHAAGFVLPSLLEGFGLPAAEAIAYDLIPLVSQGGALHEVTGDAAVLVDPLDTAGIADGMIKLADMAPHERQERLASLRISAGRFTPEAAQRGWREALSPSIELAPRNRARSSAHEVSAP